MPETDKIDEVSKISTSSGAFEIHSAGAHLSRWDSATYGPLIFSPREANYRVGNSPHGGAPICFPWFGIPTHADPGDHDGHTSNHPPFLGQSGATDKHGFARFLNWHLSESKQDEKGTWDVTYRITDEDVPEEMADVLEPFTAEFRAALGDEAASLTLTVTNTGTEPFYFEEALHTYFKVGDVDEVEIEGFEGLMYVDTTLDGSQTDRLAMQRGPIIFGEEVDRIYPTENSPRILDRRLGRQITIENQNSGTTVVWNPGPELGERLADLSEGEWRQYICVETANARDAAIHLAPGESYAMTANYRVSTLED
ncbi:MAG: D-hexose-6-phosphate mutarotase [Scrofimicrobium sp.]